MASNYYILGNNTLVEALTQIEQLSGDAQTLFVVNEAEQLQGVLTEGDIRRALISGAQVTTLVEEVMNRNFYFFRQGHIDATAFEEKRKLGALLIPILDGDGRIVEIVNLRKYVSMLPIDAVLMAGGKGERLRPLTEKTPKPLLPVGGKAIIDHNIDRLVSYGVKHINVTVNYLGEQLEKHFEEPRGEIQILTVREPKYLGTIGSIRFVKQFYNDTVLVMNSDLFTNINYEDFFLHFLQHDADMSVAAVPYTVSVPYGIFDLEGRDIQGLIEKPTYNYYANAGIYLIKRAVLDEIPKDTFFNATDLIEKLISEGKKVIRFPLNGTWIDIGNPQEYQKANELVKHLG
jgi:dTDP-glucose pyrophosphorylase